MSEQLALRDCVAIALGGMIGGGIYAVLGVVSGIAGPATWAAFVLAGVVAGCAAYAFDRLNALGDAHGGSVTFVRTVTGNDTAAGVVGWTLLFGYVGSMAMYAVAFGSFAVELVGAPATVGPVPAGTAIAVLAIAGFVGLNLLGAQVTGTAELLLVVGKVGVLLAFGLAGVAYSALVSPDPTPLGLSRLAGTTPLMAAAVSFVAFQGWQLLYYDQDSVADPEATLRRAVAISIPTAVAIYVLVAVATYALAPEALQTHPHVALSRAAGELAAVVGLGGIGAALISLSALLSTGSAINATLFSAGSFAKRLLSADLLPDRLGEADAEGPPERSLLALGALTIGFAALGSLSAVTSFASLAFVATFGVVSALAVVELRDHEDVVTAVPVVGAVGSLAFLVLMIAHLARAEPGTLAAVGAITVAVLAVELLYFERDVLAAELEAVEASVEQSVEGAVDDRRS